MLWSLGLNITGVMLVFKLMLTEKDSIFKLLLGVFLLYINVVCVLINIKIIF